VHMRDAWLMIANKLTCGNQSELARRLGVDGSTVRRWISGTRRASEPVIRLVASLAAEQHGQ
jgi:DNA-binding transcriptional regulator YdaS (Cro superfamily)